MTCPLFAFLACFRFLSFSRWSGAAAKPSQVKWAGVAGVGHLDDEFVINIETQIK
jgi:hypothetical protein